MAPRPVRIGLLWHSANSGNLGVGALTLGDIAIIGDVVKSLGLEAKFIIIGMRDGGHAYVAKEDAQVIALAWRDLFDPRRFWATVGTLDFVVDIGAGDSFADIYGLKRFAMLWLSKVIVVAKKRPLILAPQTIGPFTKPAYRFFAKLALERARAVVVRDELSLAALQYIAPQARGILAIDVAFALPYEDRSSDRGKEKTRVGLNVSGLMFDDAQSGRNRFNLSFNYAELMTEFIAELSEREDVEVHLLVHVHSPSARDDDGSVADELAKKYPGVIRVPNFAGPIEAKTYISSLDFLVSGRMHACIAAFGSGVPVVPVAYSRKFRGLFELLDYRWLLAGDGKSQQVALEYLHSCLACRAEMAQAIATGIKRIEMLTDAYRTELRSLLSEI